MNNIFIMPKATKYKGALFIEYALILAFVIVIGVFFIADTGVSKSITSIFGNTNSTMTQAANSSRKKNLTTADFEKIVAAIKEAGKSVQKTGTTSSNDADPKRGLTRSAWTTTDGSSIDNLINGLLQESGISMEDLNAKTWTFYDIDLNKGSKNYPQNACGLYWTDQELGTNLEKTTVPNAYGSKDEYNYYYYSTYDNKFYAVKSSVWLNSSSDKNNKGDGVPSLAMWTYEIGKPSGSRTGPYDTYEELMESVKK